MATALVYGWYGRGNIGDELMADAMRKLFEPKGVALAFVDRLTEADVASADAVIFGGGNILFDAPSIESGAWAMLSNNQRPIFYLGVGLEVVPHDMHKKLMAVARSVITRTGDPVKTWAPKTTFSLPDLVYALPQADLTTSGQGVLVIPNVEVLPKWNDPHWRHIAWERFKDEFAQFIDDLRDVGTRPTFLTMCKNADMDDAWPAHELIARMRLRSPDYDIIRAPADSLRLTQMISAFKVVITQRYHGIILAQMAGVPHVSVDHHDKLKLAWPRKGISVPYYGIAKHQLTEAYALAANAPREQTRASGGVYDALADAIIGIINQEVNARVEPVRGSP